MHFPGFLSEAGVEGRSGGGKGAPVGAGRAEPALHLAAPGRLGVTLGPHT